MIYTSPTRGVHTNNSLAQPVPTTMNFRGFTLIELLIVVAIIGILAAIAIPQFNAYRARAYNASAVSDLHTFVTSMQAYFHDYAKYPNYP